MAIQGNLNELYVADLIQLYCQPGVRAQLTAQREDDTLTIYFDNGELVHAEQGDIQGEEVVYELLSWKTGTFAVDQDVPPPAHSIQIPTSALILEGLRRSDEAQQPAPAAAPQSSAKEAVQPLAEQQEQKEVDLMEEAQTRSAQLTAALRSIVNSSADIQGAVVISLDGLVIGSELPEGLDQARVGAISAGLLSLSGRSLQQLARGEIKQTLVQGTTGDVIIMGAGPSSAFVALTGTDVNMGMVLLEARDGSQQIAKILGG